MMQETSISTEREIGLEQGKKLFKYGKAAHVHSMLTEGTFRIGTLFEYRTEEQYGCRIGDSAEGRDSLYDDADYDLSKPGSFPKMAREFFDTSRSPKNSYVKDLRILLRRNSVNLYLFCMSKVFDHALMKDFGYDSAFRIDEPLQFFHEISLTLRRLGITRDTVHVRSCVYRPKHVKYTDQIYEESPALVKELKYANQQEVRAIWTPLCKNIEPVLIQCVPAAQCCSLVK